MDITSKTTDKISNNLNNKDNIPNFINISLIIIWVIVISLLIILIVISAFAMYNYRKTLIINIPPSVQSCEKIVTGLPNVDDLPCCVISGELTANKFYADLNLVINPVPLYYLNVCKQFCIDGYNSIDNNCINGIGDEDFLKCVNASEPKECYGISKPVAISRLNQYYVNSPTDAICKESRTC